MGNRTNIGETKFERNRSAEVRVKDKYEKENYWKYIGKKRTIFGKIYLRSSNPIAAPTLLNRNRFEKFADFSCFIFLRRESFFPKFVL